MSNLPYDEEISLSDSDVQGDTTDAASDEGKCLATYYTECISKVRGYW